MPPSFDSEVRAFLTDAGYRSADIVEDYRYTVCTESGDLRSATVPLAAFGSPQRNMRTACVAALEAESAAAAATALRDLRYLAAPAAIVRVRESVSLYAVSHQGESPVLDESGLTEWRSRLRHRLDYLDPRNILSAKRGDQQSALFDARLFAWAEDVTERTLSKLLEEMLVALLDALPPARRRTPGGQRAALHFLFRVLAARVLEDRGDLPRDADAWRSIRAAGRALSIPEDDPPRLAIPAEAATRIIEAMRERFAFHSLTPETLAYSYENALVTNHARHELGIFYTPRAIARYVVEHLPLESIPQSKRVLFDSCCGSGSFLLAGHERLNAMLPDDWSSARRHEYLVERILGMDLEQFARETAKLSLLLAGLEVGNGWKVLEGDATRPLAGRLPKVPTIIVTNPPFLEVKEHGAARRELAADIITNLVGLLAVDGYMGVVVPQSFLESSAARSARRLVLDTCSLLEIATFPGSLFHSNAETAVLLLRKDRGQRTSKVVTIRECHGRDVAAFSRFQKFSSTYSVSLEAWERDPDARFIASPFFDLWERLEQRRPKLEDVADAAHGLQVKQTDTASVSDERRPGMVPYVERVNAAIAPFVFLADGKITSPRYLRYGDHLRRPGKRENYEAPKVLISSNRNPAYSWRFVAAVAPAGLYYADNFHGLRPRDEKTTLSELAAVLNSHVANAWFHAHCRKRKIVLRILKDLPFPKFDPAQRERLEIKVRRMTELSYRACLQKVEKQAEDGLFWTGESSGRMESLRDEAAIVLGEIDAIVFDAYGVSETERSALVRWMGMDRRPTAF